MTENSNEDVALDSEEAEPKPPSRTRRLRDRRSALGITAAAIGGAVGLGAGRKLGGTPAGADVRMVLEVAARGETWRMAAMPAIYGPEGGLDPTELRGSPFFLEGWIYPEGTIAGDGFIPTLDSAIGHWFCRGHAILGTDRPSPHLISQQEFIIGKVSEDQYFPPAMITTVGLESSNDTSQVSVRSVTGGTGKYRGARGEVLETEISLNSTISFGSEDNAPNFRFEFDFETLS